MSEGKALTFKSYWTGKTVTHKLMEETNEFTRNDILTAYAAVNHYRYSTSENAGHRRERLRNWYLANKTKF